MLEKIALKRLTASDLTFFEWQYRNRDAGNQKSINLNADVFVEEFYPAAPAIGPTMDHQIPIALTLFGPGLKGPYPLARKIVKTGSYKNWRLNGEFVHNPDGDPERFNVLEPGDLILIAFKGDPVPTASDVILISAHVPEDIELHGQLASLLAGSKRSMVRVNRADLELVAAEADGPAGHPIERFLSDPEFDAALEDAAYGSDSAARTVRRRASKRVSAADLANARQNAERIGRDGEGLVWFYLEMLRAEGEVSSVEWTSDYDAASPYDFRITTPAGDKVKIDAKSTEGPFERIFHISAAEVVEAAGSKERYDLYRVYSIDSDGGALRISEDIREFARAVVETLEALPEGVWPDSFSVNPDVLKWGKERRIERPDEPDNE